MKIYNLCHSFKFDYFPECFSDCLLSIFYLVFMSFFYSYRIDNNIGYDIYNKIRYYFSYHYFSYYGM